MLKDRKKAGEKYNKSHFKHKIEGVHGGDLPLFYKSHKEWWKNKKNYIENPWNTSQAKLLQDKKLHSRNDLMLLSDFTTKEAPQNSFKVFTKTIVKGDNIPTKPNEVKIKYKSRHQKKGRKMNYIRWSDQQGRIINWKGRLFDKTKECPPESCDYQPLFSSFSKNGIFNPPPNSKEALKRQINDQKQDIKLKGVISGKTTHRRSVIISKSFQPNISLVGEDKNLFKNLKSSNFYKQERNILQRGRSDKASKNEEKLKTSLSLKQQRSKSIRSGAFY